MLSTASSQFVIPASKHAPAKAGREFRLYSMSPHPWIPAFAGMTNSGLFAWSSKSTQPPPGFQRKHEVHEERFRAKAQGLEVKENILSLRLNEKSLLFGKDPV